MNTSTMTLPEIIKALNKHYIAGTDARLVIKRDDDKGQYLAIESNRNGMITLCMELLESISAAETNTSVVYGMSEEMFEEKSEVWIRTIRIAEGGQTAEPPDTSWLIKAGCFLALIVAGVIFITGLTTAFSWLKNLF